MDSPLQASRRDLFYILFKRKWSILIIMVTALCAAIVWLWVVREEVYTANAKILVKLGQEQAAPPTMLGGYPQVVGYRYQEVNSEVEILQNVELIGRVVDELHLDQPGPPPPVPTAWFARMRFKVKAYAKQLEEWFTELMIRLGLRTRVSRRDAVVLALQRALVVRGQKDSNVFIAELTMPYRESVAFVLNRLLDDYLVFRIKLYQPAGLDFFQKGLNRTGAELRSVEEKLQDYERAGGISVLMKQQEQLVTQIAAAETAMRESELALNEAVSKNQRLDAELKKEEPNFGQLGDFERDSFPQSVLRQMAELQRERERLRMTELDSSEKVQNNRSQLKVLADMLAANLRSTQAEKQAEFDRRKQTWQNLQAELSALHNRQMEWEDLKRNSRENEELNAFYRRKLEEVSSTVAAENRRIGNVAIIQHASTPILPTGMRKTYMLILCVVASVFVALAWVSVAEFFDHGVYTGEALERNLGAPVIGVIRVGRNPLSALAKDAIPVRGMGAHAGN